MKTNTSLLRSLAASAALVLAAATQTSFAQTTATTDPVGFITLNVLGPGTVTSPKLSLLSPTLTQPIAWQGVITVVSANTSGPTVITVSSTPTAPWTSGQFNGVNGSYYVEIVSTAVPARSGTLSYISATGTSTITTADNLVSPNVLAAVGDTIRIRKDVTIGDLFGVTNTAGLLASNDPTTADEVLIYDAATSTPYFYYNGPGPGWYDSAFTLNPGDAAKVAIAPHQGVVIKRKAAAAISFTSNGAVKTGNTLFPVVNGLNVLGTASSMGLTLDSSGLYTGNAATGVKPSDDPSTADEVTIYTATSQTNYFYYIGGGGFLAGWYDSGFSTATPVGATVTIAPGTAFVLKRKGGPNFNWTLPSPSSF